MREPQARAGFQIDLHGDVGGEITPESVSAALRRAGKGPLTISLHSYGGDAMAGVAIHNMLARHPGMKTVVVEGVAASAASLIAMAGDRIIMPSNALMMIHEAWGLAMGASGDLRDRADVLDTVSAAYRKTYAARTGKTEDEIAALMAAETWFTAKEAVAAGFADEITEARPARALAGAEKLLARFHNIPAPLAAIIKEKPMDGISSGASSPVPATLAEVKAIAARAGLPAEWVINQVEAAATPEAARDAAIDAVAARAAVQPIRAVVGHSWDAPASIRERASEALAARVTGNAVSGPAQEFRGLSVAELGRRVLEASGQRLPRNAPPAVILAAAITTSDFPMLLTETMTRVLQTRLAAAPGAARLVCAQRTAPDFRAGRFLQFAGIKELEQLKEGAVIPHAPPAERGEAYRVRTWARGSTWSRQALVNDDLGALDQMSLFANAVVATEAQAFLEMFAANGSGWGPNLADAQPLFHSSHGNVGSGAVGTTGISAGRIVMRAQTDASGNLIAPEPRIMLVGPLGETAAEQALNQTTVATAEGDRPVFANRLTLAVEPRITGSEWFLFADPAVAPVLAMVTLEGSDGVPRITQHESANVDGLSWKLTHDFVIAPMAFVGGVRMTGS